MGFNGEQITEYKDGRDAVTGTLARGSTFNNEFIRLYGNDNYLKSELDKLGGASLDTDVSMAANSDLKVPSQKAAKAYVDNKISDLIGGAPATLDTLNEIASALNDDENIAATLLARIYASQQQNLIYNYDFRYFSNQLSTISSWYDYLHPDGWVYTDPGTDGKIGYDTGNGCCKIQTSSDGSGARVFKQALHEFVNWGNLLKGATVTLKAFVKGGNATVKLTDGITVLSYALLNTGAIEEVTLQLSVSSSATELTVSIESSAASNVLEIYKVYANRGTTAIESLPCIVQGVIGELKSYDATEVPPAGELLIYSVELPAGYTRLNSYLNGKFGTGSNGRSKLDDALGRYDRNWANGSANDPDRASRTTRGDGITGDHVGTKLGWQNLNHRHSQIANADDNSSGAIEAAQAGRNTGYTIYGNYSGGNQTNPIDRNTLKTIRWC